MIAPHSSPYILGPLVLAFITLFFSQYWFLGAYISLFFIILSLFFSFFFRDPPRPIQEGLISPADGTIIAHHIHKDKDIGPAQKLSIFMNLWDVHINRFPLDGTLIKMQHHPGGHRPAFTQESYRNEQYSYLMETPHGKIKIVQIAGTFARRIVPYVKPNQRVHKGEKIGIVRFGSRVDLYLPPHISLDVKIGTHIHAGETLTTTLSSSSLT